MRTWSLRAGIGIALLALASACAPALPPGWQREAGTHELVHAPSGYRFPQTLHGLQRTDATSFDSLGQNVAIGYQIPSLLDLTLYLYPMSFGGVPDAEGHFRAVVGDVLAVHPDAVVDSARRIELPLGTRRTGGYLARLHWTEGEEPIGSLLFLLPRPDDRFLKLRVSYRTTPEMDETRAAEIALGFLLSLPAGSEPDSLLQTSAWQGR